MRVAALLLFLLLAGGCRSQGEFKPLLSAHPMVNTGMSLQPGSDVWTIDGDGHVFQNGHPTTLASAGKLAREDSVRPVLIEVPKGAQVKAIQGLLDALIGDSHRANISFLASTSSGFRRVVMPVPRDLSPPVLAYVVGETRYEDESPDQKHLIVRGGVGHSGRFNVEEVVYGPYHEAVRFPVDGESGGGIQKNPPWDGKHPPVGTWILSQIREFLESPQVKTLSPILIVQVVPENGVEDFLICLDMLHQAALGKTVVHIPHP